MTEDEKLERIGLNLSKNLNDFLRNHGIGLSEFYRKAGEDFLPRYLEKIQEELKKAMMVCDECGKTYPLPQDKEES
jgi:hypothetical protein